MILIYAIHRPEPEKLEAVVAEMRTRGAPALRVVDCGDHYEALEGSHRLAAAAQLGLEPILEVHDQDEVIDISGFDWFDAANWSETNYPAWEVVGELISHISAVPYEFEETP